MEISFKVGDLVYREYDRETWLYEILALPNKYNSWHVFRHINTWKPASQNTEDYIDFNLFDSGTMWVLNTK